MNETRKDLCIESQKKLNLFGDIDTLLKMKIHLFQKEFLDQNIDKKLQSFLPKEFFTSITNGVMKINWVIIWELNILKII